MTGDWKAGVRRRTQAVDAVIVLCGEHMSTATGVDAELRITREERMYRTRFPGH